LRVKTSTMRAWILKRRIPKQKSGGKVLLRRCDLEEFLSRGFVPAKTA
jgi:excisionase family DNA binding protein